MPKLYYTPGVCSLSPHIALYEAGLSFTKEKVDLATKKTETGADFKALNPKGYVPAFQLDDGTMMTEGPAIVLWIASQVPAGKLAPAMGTPEYFKVLEWLVFIGTELHKNFGPLFNPAVNDDAKAAIKERLKLRLSTANELLGKGPYVMGSTFTVADGYLFTVTGWMPKMDLDIAQWPNLAAFRETMLKRPSVIEAMKAEGLIS
jgi:glutathione S-transferase